VGNIGNNPSFDFFAFFACFDTDGEPLVDGEFVGPLDGDIVGTGVGRILGEFVGPLDGDIVGTG
jgi:hypothetical protein